MVPLRTRTYVREFFRGCLKKNTYIFIFYDNKRATYTSCFRETNEITLHVLNSCIGELRRLLSWLSASHHLLREQKGGE